MIRKLLLLCAVPLAAVAQIADTAATDEGSRLFFTSYNRLTGTNQSFRSKILSWDAAHGVQLVYDPPAENVCGRFPSVAAVRPVECMSIVGDGSLVAFHTLTYDEPPRSTGMLLHTDTGEVEIAGRFAMISRNGRFLYNGDAVIDRTTGASRPVPPSIFVGDDGSVLYQDGINLHRLEADGADHSFEIPALRLGSIGSIDANGTMVGIISVPFVSVPFVVILVDTRSGAVVNLTRGSSTGGPVLSPDATRVVFSAPVSPDTSTGQLLNCRTDGADCRPVSTAPVNASLVALSRDATIVYALTTQNRILRIDTRSNRAEEAFVIPWFYPLVEAPALRGSLLRFYAVNAMARVDAAYFRDTLRTAARDADRHVSDLARRALEKLSRAG